MTRWICSSGAPVSMTITMTLLPLLGIDGALLGEPLEPSALVDDSLEDPPDRPRFEGPRVRVHHALENVGLTLGCVHRQAEAPLDPSDLDGACRAAVQKADELLVDPVDPLTPAGELLLVLPSPAHLPPFSHSIHSPTLPGGFSSKNRTKALPTTTPSATSAAAFTC